MPVLYPMAFSMAAELGGYGFVSGAVYGKKKHKGLLSIYAALLTAMAAGRVFWAWAMLLLLGMQNFTAEMFLAGAFFNAIPGMVLQLILIPVLVLGLERAGVTEQK